MIQELEPRSPDYRKVPVRTRRVWLGLAEISTSNIRVVIHRQDEGIVGVAIPGHRFEVHEGQFYTEYTHPDSPLYPKTPTLKVYTSSNT